MQVPAGPRARLAHWRALGARRWVLDAIRDGVRPSLARPVMPFDLGELKIQEAAQLQAWQALKAEYLQKGAIRQVATLSHCSPAFLVAKKSSPGKFRLVIDLRHFNEHGHPSTVRYDDLHTLADDVQQGDWLASFDLQDGYMHLAVAPEFQHYLGFRVNGECFVCCTLPFGWNDSPRIFQAFSLEIKRLATSRPALKVARRHAGKAWHQHLRPATFRLRCYLDDYLLVARTRAAMLSATRHMRSLLRSLGVLWHTTKSRWEPTQRLTHLGLEIDSKQGVLRVPEDRLRELKAFAKFVQHEAGRNKRWLPARTIAKFAGKAISVMMAVGPARFFLRSMFQDLKGKSSWNARIKLSHQSLRDLGWWKQLPAKWNGKSFLTPRFTYSLTVDASKLGWAGILRGPNVLHGRGLLARGHWSAEQRSLPISALEFLGLYHSLVSFRSFLRNNIVRVRTDNTGVLHDVRHLYARADSMFDALRQVFFFLDANNVQLLPEYVASEHNEADGPSRVRDTNEWKLHPSIFHRLDQRWGPHSVDRFASSLSTQLPVYNSLNFDPFTAGVDALAQPDWLAHNNYCNPPWCLLPRLLALLRAVPGVRATVVAPLWRDTLWFQQLMAITSEFFIVPAGSTVFASALTGAASYSMSTRWPVIVCRVG